MPLATWQALTDLAACNGMSLGKTVQHLVEYWSTTMTQTRDTIIQQAAQASYDDDANQVVGLHPVFGWVYRHGDDLGAIAELTQCVTVNSAGEVEDRPATYTYSAVGSVRGSCGHLHKTARHAWACVRADQNGCREQGGYSDRAIERSDGVLVDEEGNP